MRGASRLKECLAAISTPLSLKHQPRRIGHREGAVVTCDPKFLKSSRFETGCKHTSVRAFDWPSKTMLLDSAGLQSPGTFILTPSPTILLKKKSLPKLQT